PAGTARTSRAERGLRPLFPETAQPRASPRSRTIPVRAGSASAPRRAHVASDPRSRFVLAPERTDDSPRHSCAARRLESHADERQYPLQDRSEANQNDENLQKIREPPVTHIFVDDPEHNGGNDDGDEHMNQDQKHHNLA